MSETTAAFAAGAEDGQHMGPAPSPVARKSARACRPQLVSVEGVRNEEAYRAATGRAGAVRAGAVLRPEDQKRSDEKGGRPAA